MTVNRQLCHGEQHYRASGGVGPAKNTPKPGNGLFLFHII